MKDVLTATFSMDDSGEIHVKCKIHGPANGLNGESTENFFAWSMKREYSSMVASELRLRELMDAA